VVDRVEIVNPEPIVRVAFFARSPDVEFSDRLLVVRAIGQGVERAYLLTTTIASLAESWGFQRIDRKEVPAAIQATRQFDGACCASAVAMRQDLKNAVKIACT
jgi:hypothetical protein